MRARFAAAMFRLSALLLAGGAHAQAAADPFADDGWYTWQVAAVEDAPRWCCASWAGGRAEPAPCRLDADNFGFYDAKPRSGASEWMQVYAQVRDGSAVRVRALSPACPVASPATFTDLGRVAADRSLQWLNASALTGADDDALAAIAVHRGDAARDLLTGLAMSSENPELRDDAIFWLGQVRIADSRDTLVSLMFTAADPDVRQQAAFSYSESPAADVAELLIRQGRDDRSAGVRGQAWFWLAQTGIAGSEDAILHAIRNDPSRNVREDAVFALSQLPGERAVHSLLSIVDDAGIDRKLRREALFWLAESDSELAYEMLDRLLSATPP